MLNAARLSLAVTLLLSACNFPVAVDEEPTGAPPLPRAPTLPPTQTSTPTPAVTVTPWPTLATTPQALSPDLEGQRAAMRPDFTDDVDARGPVTRYSIEVSVEFAPEATTARVQGAARIQYTNQEAAPLDDLILMLWPNDKQYDSEIVAGPAVIDGVQVVGDAELNGLALRYRLPSPLGPGESMDLTVPFRLVASGPIGGLVPKRLGITEGVFIAPTFYPLVPRRVGGEWEAEEVPRGGDTTNSDIAFYTVTIDAPAELGLAASGVEQARDVASGRQRVTFATGPARDFAFALGPFEVSERVVEGVTLRVWTLPEHRGDVRRVLDAAALQMETLTRLIGPYPYTELDFVDAPGAFGGIEYPSLVFIGTFSSRWLEVPVIHEVAHQWFYGLVGNDQVHEPWLDEGAATFAETLYYENGLDPDRATWTLTEFRARVRGSRDPEAPVGLSVGDYASEGEYALVVYLKGALFFDALRRELGDPVFFAFLKAYFQEYRYGFATTQDFLRMAEGACTCELDALFDQWVLVGGPLPQP